MNTETLADEGEFLRLVNLYVEGVATDDEVRWLQASLEQCPALIPVYVDFMMLHGTLHWEAGLVCDVNLEPGQFQQLLHELDAPVERSRSVARRLRRHPLTTIAAMLLVALCGFTIWKITDHSQSDAVVAENDDTSTVPDDPATSDDATPTGFPRIELDKPTTDDAMVVERDATNEGGTSVTPVRTENRVPAGELIDQLLARGWEDARVKPSLPTSDQEWIRRCYLDLVGRIPTSRELERFHSDEGPYPREQIVEQLLASEDFNRHWSTVWTNLLVGRNPRVADEMRELRSYLRDQFANETPWNTVVADVIAAEGTLRENGATSFLVAHLNNEAVPATAITSRVFLGRQIQCVQCHNHPHNDWTQDQFWQLNAFFQQTELERHQSSETDDMQAVQVNLVSNKVGGPTFYETRNGLMKVAYPEYGEKKIAEDEHVNRREELAKLIASDDDRQLSRAFVNRVWAEMFGYGFTNPVDDMGPHNPPTHPELLDELAARFAESDYDLRALLRWICLSDAYQLSSEVVAENRMDRPDAGEPPLFTRAYLKPMTPEQLYDSLHAVSGRTLRTAEEWNQFERDRDRWIRRYTRDFETEENDASVALDGTIQQALELMNGEYTQTLLEKNSNRLVSRRRVSDAEQIREICLAVLSREPTERELKVFRNWLSAGNAARNPQIKRQRVEDVYWAYLNSNEFSVIH